MHGLFIVNSYNFKPGPNGLCTKQVVREYVSRNNQAVILTRLIRRDQPHFEIQDGTEVYSLRRCLQAFPKKNLIVESIFQTWYRLLNLVWAVLGARYWPLTDPLLAFRYYRKARRLYRQKPFDTVIGVYNGMDELFAAMLIKRKFPQVRMIVYTLDALTGRQMQKSKRLEHVHRNSLQKWERNVFHVADVICVMASHEAHYQKAYYDNIREKIICMDIPLLDLSRVQDAALKEARHGALKKAVYTGYMCSYTGNPLYFLKILQQIDGIELHIYGTIEETLLAQIKATGLMNRLVFYHGQVLHEQIIQVQNDADFLLNFGCINPNMVSCKVFEYLSARKPIINLYRILDDSSLPYLNAYPNALQVFEDDNKLADNIGKISAFFRRTDFTTIDEKFLLENYYSNLPIQMADIIVGDRDKTVTGMLCKDKR